MRVCERERLTLQPLLGLSGRGHISPEQAHVSQVSITTALSPQTNLPRKHLMGKQNLRPIYQNFE